MGLKGIFFGFLLVFMAATSGYCEEWEESDLWVIQQDFVKFGKGEAYEVHKKGFLKGFQKYLRQGPICTYAEKDIDSPQYIYLSPVRNYKGLGEWMKQREKYLASLSRDVLMPYLNTLNFTIESLHQYLPHCSFLPKGQESIFNYEAIQFCLYGVMPPNEDEFETRLIQIASEQLVSEKPICFRAWKVVMGSDTPKYLIAVFAKTAKEAENDAEDLDFIGNGIKKIIRLQKSGTALLRKDFSAPRK